MKTRKKIYQFDTDGNFIKEWTDVKEVVQCTDFQLLFVNRVIMGKLDSIGGFVWMDSTIMFFMHKDLNSKEVKDFIVNRVIAIKLATVVSTRRVKQYSQSGEFIHSWDSIAIASKELGLDRSGIDLVCKGVRSLCDGYIWRYNDSQLPVRLKKRKGGKVVFQYTTENELVREWNSGSEAEREMGYSRANISCVCNGKKDIAYGYKWSFKPIKEATLSEAKAIDLRMSKDTRTYYEKLWEDADKKQNNISC